MKKIKKINLGLIIATATYLIFVIPVSLAAINPNYGTTTFFSEKKDEVPPANPPMYDVGLRSGNKDKKNSSKNNDSDPGGSLFGRIINGVGSFFGNSNNSSVSSNSDSEDASRKSLFDFQSNSNQGAGGAGAGFIMGARGESYENLDDDEIEKYNKRLAQKFDFKENNKQAATKKSKLIFTNIVIPINMTTQYVLIILSILIAVGSAIGYYFWKKEEEKKGKKSRRKNYD